MSIRVEIEVNQRRAVLCFAGEENALKWQQHLKMAGPSRATNSSKPHVWFYCGLPEGWLEVLKVVLSEGYCGEVSCIDTQGPDRRKVVVRSIPDFRESDYPKQPLHALNCHFRESVFVAMVSRFKKMKSKGISVSPADRLQDACVVSVGEETPGLPTISTATTLCKEIAARSYRDIILDLSSVGTMGFHGLAEILRLKQLCEEDKAKRLMISCQPGGTVCRMLHFGDEKLDIFSSVAEASSALLSNSKHFTRRALS